MDLELRGKSVFIAGASRGIGLAIARAFLNEGAKVFLTARQEAPLSDTQRALAKDFPDTDIAAFAGDMTVTEDIDAALDRAVTSIGPLDAVIANVGSGRGPTGLGLTSDDWRRMLDINLIGSMLLAGRAAPHMNGPGSSITFISSIAGSTVLPAPVPYSAAKAALEHSARIAACDMAADGLRVNVVSPGNTYFPGGTWDNKQQEDPEGVAAYIRAEVPLNRFASAEEIAEAVLFLSSARAAFITGAVLPVDGGQSLS
jgi:3-oxoacyl-[acyl-carrier protein] reductase